LQQVEGLRTDVEVQYVYPRGEELSQSWLNAIDAGLQANRPVMVDMFFRDQFNASPYFFKPLATEAWQVCLSACPVPEAYPALDINLGGKFLVSGPRPITPSAPAGESMTLSLEYQLIGEPSPYTTFFVHLIDRDGNVIGQSDQTVPTGRYAAADNFVVRFSVTPLVDVKPGEYQLLTGAYTQAADGSIELLPKLDHRFKPTDITHVPVTSATVTPAQRLIDPDGIDLASGIVYLNSSISNGEVKSGDEVKVNLNFTAARPLLRDTVVSVQLTGNGWRVTNDFVPALGAIPTLKWIAGSPVLDPHTLKIPENAAPGPAQVSVILYDNFTQEPLALLDAELIKQGQAIPIGTVNVTPK
jgi:hypothetical protein